MAKRYHEDALNGYSKLSLEERGVYTTILDLYYSRGGAADYQDASDERWLAGWCGCSTRLLRPIIERLIGKGKLSLRAGTLVNDRANKELGLVRERQRTARGCRSRRRTGQRCGEAE